MSLVDFVLGRPAADPGPPEGEGAFPAPIEIMGVLKAALRDKLLDVTEARALVPAHYTVLLHADAYRYLEPAFPVLMEAAGEELSKEVDRLSRVPFGEPRDEGARAPDVPEPPVCRDVRPVEPTWSVEFVPVLYTPDGERVPPSYLAVATRLTAPEAPEVVGATGGEATLSVTTVDPFSGAYASRAGTAADLRPAEGAASMTVRAPFTPAAAAPAVTPAPAPTDEPKAAPSDDASELPPGTLATLSYKYPGQSEVHVFPVTAPRTVVGRRTPENEHVDLRLDVEIQVSAEHAHLRYDEASGRFELMDVSSFGTWIDGAPVPTSDPEGGAEHWVPLPDGATVNLAGLVFLAFRAATA